MVTNHDLPRGVCGSKTMVLRANRSLAADYAGAVLKCMYVCMYGYMIYGALH